MKGSADTTVETVDTDPYARAEPMLIHDVRVGDGWGRIRVIHEKTMQSVRMGASRNKEPA